MEYWRQDWAFLHLSKLIPCQAEKKVFIRKELDFVLWTCPPTELSPLHSLFPGEFQGISVLVQCYRRNCALKKHHSGSVSRLVLEGELHLRAVRANLAVLELHV